MNRKNIDIMRRGRCLAQGQHGQGPVVYWMSRDQRVEDNWALLWAQQEALIHQKGLIVVFCMIPDYPEATSGHYSFMRKGLKELQEKLNQYNIGFRILEQSPDAVLPSFLGTIDARLLVCDFDPLRIKQQWKKMLIDSLEIPLHEVDTHNIVPAWIISDKKEYAAYTLRPKIKRVLDDYLTDIPAVQHHPFNWNHAPLVVPETLHKEGIASQTTEAYPWVQAGEAAASMAASNFVQQRLGNYVKTRNNPCIDGQSGLSPYLHFGQLSPQRLAWMVSRSDLPIGTKETFLEELVVRRELADNFCYYESAYDRFAGFPDWARKTLDQHRNDKRAYVYSLAELENGITHEILWNACQQDLVQSGKLHGFLRMYWAKKILEWTPDPETALEYAITLNDRYSLDGRDPNGYTGIAWSLGGVHDRAWRERSVFGKIRYMNEAGCRRKFDVERYIATVFNKD
ncbi:MAG: deoxyribodipyrimidine photo-lyase [Desulfobulbaceae bacterium]|nr:deoxyribodipyrimidine photo-lyase [Desulfobulbaceae bacterium]